MSPRGPVSFAENGTGRDGLNSLHMDGLRDDYFSAEGSDVEGSPSTTTTTGRRRASLSIRIPPPPGQADMAFTALQYLPMPILVLSSAKSIVLANEAMGRLLGIDPTNRHSGSHDGIEEETRSATEILYGVNVSQLGFDMLQGGSAVFIAWEDFLETVVDDASRMQSSTSQLNKFHGRAHTKKSSPSETMHRRASSISSSKVSTGMSTEVHDAVLDVVFSTDRDSETGLPMASRHDVASHIQAQMIVSVWATEDEQYFTLTLTASSEGSPASSEAAKSTSRTVSRSANSFSSIGSGLSSASSSESSGQRRSIGHPHTPTTPSHPNGLGSGSARPDVLPRGPPAKTSSASAPTMFSKSNRLKDAILNSMQFPAYAMWKDETFGIPNKAAIRLLYPWIEDGAYDSNEQARDFLLKYTLYHEDFSAELPFEEYPLMRLMKAQKAIEACRVGMYSAKDGSRILFDVASEAILDDKGEFIGGLVIFQDVTDFAMTIDRQQKENESQFENICNMVPQMIWRTTPTGQHDYFSDGWYSFTGMTPEESCGEGWQQAFHPDDVAAVYPTWQHCLATGDIYLVEYRCKNATGEWRWMLGRAQPMRDEKGTIVKWFGTCTDIHELVLAREEAKQTRAQLASVIEHGNISLWAVDMDRKLRLFEGKPMYSPDPAYDPQQKFLGTRIEDIFRAESRVGEIKAYLDPLERVMTGEVKEQTIEIEVAKTSRWYRTRIVPILRQDRTGGIEGENFIDGAVGISMDVTAFRQAAQELKARERENARLMAQSVAAKEASKMKSQFLANMSHEIRTPIAGVIGMSELLLDDESGELTQEQRECAVNIQRSANGLLTVINDILDFSKVESGRLDIEEVQFDLSVVIHDVNKMLSFAAERKGLKFIDDIQQLQDWKVMGDPGRLRQVMTNLLTNSIKFTSEGSVTLRVQIQKETRETVEVIFSVEDTGIGIEEEGQQKLFKPFSQADSSTARRFGGTGLGLTISKNLVELMRGHISLESTPGVGTKATFWIPFHKAPYQSASASPIVEIGSIPDRLQSERAVSQASSENGGSPSTFAHPQQGHRRDVSTITQANTPPAATYDDSAAEQLSAAERKDVQILVVEDNPINQQIALKTIKKLGFPVTAVWNGKEALDYLKHPSASQPRPDIILMDVQMPIMDGYLATYTIRNSASFAGNPIVRNTPIVAMTASAIQGDREKCQQSGMDDYLAKPVKKPHLEMMLVKWAIEGRKKRRELAKNPTDSYFPLRGGTSQIATSNRPSFTSRNPPSFVSDASSHRQTPEEHLASELDRLEFAHRAAFVQSAESTSDLAIRHQQDEEKAITLRDESLMESGEDPRARLGPGISDETYHSVDDPAAAALTTENMKKHSQADRMAALKRSAGADGSTAAADDSSSMRVTLDGS